MAAKAAAHRFTGILKRTLDLLNAYSSETHTQRDLKMIKPTHLPGGVSVERQVFAGLAEGSPFAQRAFFADKDERMLAVELPAMSQDEFSAAFRGSPM